MAIANTDEFLKALLKTSTDCIKILDLDGQLRFMSDGGQVVMEVDDFGKIEGCPWPDFWAGDENEKARHAVEEAKAGRVAQFQGFAQTAKGSPRWWHVVVAPINGPDGKPEQLLSISTDITDKRRAEQLLRQSEQSLAMMANSIPQLAWMTDRDGTINWYNQRWYDFTGTTFDEMKGSDWKKLYHPDHIERVLSGYKQALQTGKPWEDTFPIRGADGRYRWFLTRALPIHDHDQNIVRWLGTNTDVTAQGESAAHQRLLMEELQHRVKNTLAIVQSMAVQTFRKAPSIEKATNDFSSRLMALGRAYDVLLDESWSSADIVKVVSDAVQPHDDQKSRFRVGGPSLRLAARPALALAMVLHELCTNASKYGSLSAEAGHIDIVWRIEGHGEGAQLILLWTEHGGPRVKPPRRKSFGSLLIEQGLGPQFGSTGKLAYEPDGVRYTIEAPLASIQEKANQPVA